MFGSSFWLDIRSFNHLGPFLGLVGDELAEVGRRTRNRNAAQIGEPRLHRGVGEARVDLLVDLVDDLGRRTRPCGQAVPAAYLIARYELAHSRRPVGSAAQRAAVVPASARSFPALMNSIDEGIVANRLVPVLPADR